MGSSRQLLSMGRFLILVSLSTLIVIISANQGRLRSDIVETNADEAERSDRVLRAAEDEKKVKNWANDGGTKKRKSKDIKRNSRKSKDVKKKKQKETKRKEKKEKKKNKNKKKKTNLKKKKKCKGPKCKDRKKNKKKNKKLNKKRRNKKKEARQNTCTSGNTRLANRTCMEAAILGMAYERDQISNYLKQSKLLNRHQTLSGNKAGKHDLFWDAQQHLLWAIGGNWSDPKCGPNDTSSGRYNSTKYAEELQLAKTAHDVLLNCSVAIKAACNMSNLDDHDSDGVSENITLCKDMKKDAILANTRCQSLTTDVDAQCACWINQTILIKRIKEAKCQIKDSQKKVTQFKNNCIKIFGQCQRMMDKSVESVYYCMDDHSMSFINQTTDSLASSINRDAARRFNLDRFLTDFDEKFSN